MQNTKCFKICQIASENDIGIQFADIIGWTVFQSIERNNKKYILRLKDNFTIFKYEIEK